MKPISDILFDKKIETIELYKEYVKLNNIKLPTSLHGKRKIFIDWYINNHNTNIETNIEDLSKHYLYISQRTIENILSKK